MKGPSLIPTLERLTILLAISPFFDSPKKSRESLLTGWSEGEGVETMDVEAEAEAETSRECVLGWTLSLEGVVCGGMLQPLMGLVATSTLRVFLELTEDAEVFSQVMLDFFSALSDIDSFLARRFSAPSMRSHAFPKMMMPFKTLE